MKPGCVQFVELLNFLCCRTISFGNYPERISSFYHMSRWDGRVYCSASSRTGAHLGYHSSFEGNFKFFPCNNIVAFPEFVGAHDFSDTGMVASCNRRQGLAVSDTVVYKCSLGRR